MEDSTEEQLNFEVQKLNLKVQALLEDITQTRNQNADYRVEITVLQAQLARLQSVQTQEEDTSATE